VSQFIPPGDTPLWTPPFPTIVCELLGRLTLKRLAGAARFGVAPMESVCGDGAPHAGTVVPDRVRGLFRFFAGTTRELSDRPLDPFGLHPCK